METAEAIDELDAILSDEIPGEPTVTLGYVFQCGEERGFTQEQIWQALGAFGADRHSNVGHSQRVYKLVLEWFDFYVSVKGRKKPVEVPAKFAPKGSKRLLLPNGTTIDVVGQELPEGEQYPERGKPGEFETQQEMLDRLGAPTWHVNAETGEIDVPGILQYMGWSEMPTPETVTQDQIEEIIDQIVQARAAAEYYREQAERRARRKEAKALAFEAVFGDLIDKYVQPRLPQYKAGKHVGELKSKHLKFTTGTVYYSQTGGPEVADWNLYKQWLNELPEETLITAYGGAIERKANSKIVAAAVAGGERIPGWKLVPTNPLGKRKISK